MKAKATIPMIACALAVAACQDTTITAPELLQEITIQQALSGGQWSVDMIKVGGSLACAIDGGNAYCWGRNDHGQLGDGTTTNRPVPTRVQGGHDFVHIDALASHTCALTSDGDLYCWGANADGQLGEGTTTDRHQPTRVSFAPAFEAVSTGDRYTCALDEGGAAWCWGYGGEGQLGSAATGSTVPSRVGGGLTFASIEVGRTSTCAVQPDGSGYCWGHNVVEGTIQTTPHAVAGAVRFRSLVPGRSYNCGLGTDDLSYCFVGDDVPTPNWGDRTWIAISDNHRAACGLDAIGDIYCGGAPMLVFGGGNLTSFSGSVPIFTGPEPSTYDNVCALDSDGFAYCRGFNGSGELGTGTTGPSVPELRPVFSPVPSGRPGVVVDLLIQERSATSVTLSWTQVDDGTGAPAWYRMKYAGPGIHWPSATVGCRRTMRGDAIGAAMSCTVEGLNPDTQYDFQLAAFRSVSGMWVSSTLSGVARGFTGTYVVDDLRVTERDFGWTSVVWTQVDDGTGNPARYRLKHASEIAPWRQATTACTVVGTSIGSSISCSIRSENFYAPEETFEIRLMSYRVDENGVWQDARYSNLVVVEVEPFLR